MKKPVNIGEQIVLRKEYFVLAKKLFASLKNSRSSSQKKIVIAIGGESGCGKSTTAICLEREFIENNIKCTTLHMDSYFKLPPKDNHLNRLKNIENVGPHEINMSLLNNHIIAFKTNKAKITIPNVIYSANTFSHSEINLSDIQVLIIEGVYSFLLQGIDYKVFLSRTYIDTLQNRIKRNREKYDPFIEKILQIEHEIVLPLANEADYTIDQNYMLK